MDLKSTIRQVPNFPKEGINFIDITTLVKNKDALKEAIRRMAANYLANPPDQIVGIESRGFIFGTGMALELDCGFVPVRKPGKLPAETISESYELEYGTDTIEIHKDAIQSGQKVLIVDDLLATGGTAQAAARLVEKCGGEIMGIVFLVELDFLHGREKLKDYPVVSLLHYDSE